MARKDDVAQVHRLWRGGEKGRALALADEAKLKDEEKPEGMERHRRGRPVGSR